ncbi:class B sortase (plasmid) [Enterocloster clostridioformis]
MKRIEKIFIVICLAVLLIATILLYCGLNRYNAGKKDYITICRLAGMEEGVGKADQQSLLTTENVMTAENPDYRAWIRIDGTNVNYPVVREREDGYYLTHTFRGLDNPCGAIFMDANCSFLESGNTIIYGHNMRDRSMFGSLKNYLKEDYYKEHEWIQVVSDCSEYRFRIYSCVLLEDGDSRGYIYDFESMEEKINFIEEMKGESVITTDYKPDGTETLLTLSTCHGNDSRLLILAAMPREGGTDVQKEYLS